MLANLINRLDELDSDMETLAEVFDQLCTEFNLNSTEIENVLGCKDPYALVGYVEATASM